MLDKQLESDANTVLVTFALPADVSAESACVVGEFNEWSRTATPMRRSDGGFVAAIPLAAGRAYRFRYLLEASAGRTTGRPTAMHRTNSAATIRWLT